MKLRLINTMTGNVCVLEFEDAGTSGLYWKGEVDVPAELSDGEYRYELIEGEEVLATGLAMKGTVKKGMDKAYQSPDGGYRQYNG